MSLVDLMRFGEDTKKRLSLPSRVGTESREGRNGSVKRSVPCSPPCSRRSRCSRFIVLKRSVRYKSNRETRENRESSYGLFVPFVTFALFAVYVSKTECPQYFQPRNARKPRKVCTVCFSLFVPFVAFAVHGIQRECPL